MRRLTLLFITLLFSSMLLAQDVSPAYILFRISEDQIDTESQTRFQSGWPIAVRKQNQYGGKQVLPKFGQVVISDMTVNEAKSYMVSWNRVIDWEITNSTPATDTHSLQVYVESQYVSASGLNGLTRNQVESYLNKWNATVDSVFMDRVNFTANIYDAITSEGFWGVSLDENWFDETDYNQATGDHFVMLYYASIPNANPDNLGNRIAERGCVVYDTNPAGQSIEFYCNRSTVFQRFKEDVKMRLDGQFSLRKWRIDSTAVNAIINAGGSIEITKAQAQNYFLDRLSE